MSQIKTKGTCQLCNEVFSKGGMSTHLRRCLKSQPKGEPDQVLYHLRVEGAYEPMYWLHLEIPATETLYTLDHFLREIWLECCGHLSGFNIEGRRFENSPVEDFWGSTESTEIALGDILKPKMKFGYLYDFGSTTELSLQVIGQREGAPINQYIAILARNEAPEITCEKCKETPAKWAYSGVFLNGEHWLCDPCHKEYGSEEMALPIVNSPRVGVCDYIGDFVYEDEDDDDVETSSNPELTGRHLEVEKQIVEQLRDRYTYDGLSIALSIWSDYATFGKPQVRSIAVYVAAVEYITARMISEKVTQGDLAKRYGTTTASISQTSRKITELLEIDPKDRIDLSDEILFEIAFDDDD